MDSNIPQIKVSHDKLEEPDYGCKNFENCVTPKMDRYIPNRSLNDLEKSHHYLVENKHSLHRILNFSINCKALRKNNDLMNLTPAKILRKVDTASFLALDAPQVENNFYLNLLDWSDSSILAVGLGKEIFLWNHKTHTSYELSPLLKQSAANVSSIKWIDNEHLALGNLGFIQIWDVNCRKCISSFQHPNKVTSIDINDRILTSSSCLDNNILCHDLRAKAKIGQFESSDSICSIRWNSKGRFLAAGSSQGLVYIHDIFSGLKNAKTFDTLRGHCSSVKALSWCPWQSNSLATGGGLFDKKINFWNIYSSKNIKTLQVQSQVTNIVWSRQCKEILYSDFNDLVIYKFPSMQKVAEIKEHNDRVISVALSKDEIVASLSADETIRLWNVFKNLDSKRVPISVKKLDFFQNIR